MSAYCLFDIWKITDPDKVAKYRKQVYSTVERYEGRYLVPGGSFDLVEGDWQLGIPVINVFPGLAQAHRWYDSVEYCPLKALRLAGKDSCAVFIDGRDTPEESVHA